LLQKFQKKEKKKKKKEGRQERRGYKIMLKIRKGKRGWAAGEDRSRRLGLWGWKEVDALY